MLKLTARHVGRTRLRPTCPRIGRDSSLPSSTIPTHHAYTPLRINGSIVRRYADSRLDLVALDKKWQQIWAEKASSESGESRVRKKSGDCDADNNDMYILPMFPYPSGNLHLGHLRNYTIPDVISRFMLMSGHNVLHPMGWDAFGLPAENAAIERGIDPAQWTKQNIAKMKEQLLSMNGKWNWEREIATCDPEFYKHTQSIFQHLHRCGLAYQAESMVNWDPVDKTVLANEQVDHNGCSWRSGAKVEQKKLKQWYLKISDYREKLLEDLEILAKEERWPQRVIAMQKNWLGRRRGARINFQLFEKARLDWGEEVQEIMDKPVSVFTSRPDTLFGVQYLALSASHPIVLAAAKTDPKLQQFVDEIPDLPEHTKAGYLINGVRAVNPLTMLEKESGTGPSTEEKETIPIYVAPYVLGDYGDGAVMGVPGHDLRDFAFWQENGEYEEVKTVVVPEKSPGDKKNAVTEVPFVDRGRLNSSCGHYAGQKSAAAGHSIVQSLKAGEHADFAETWRLRDWLISRQRYWGTPIPMIHCDDCGAVPVKTEDLPVELPAVQGSWLQGKGGNPLESVPEWSNVPCPQCAKPAKRDTDTMDTFVDSSWYYMRFLDPHNKDVPFDQTKLRSVDLYIGGVEHAILHLLYARFIFKFLIDNPINSANKSELTIGASKNVPAAVSETPEPFLKLITQGMVHGKTYSDPSNGRFLKPEEVDLSNPSNPKVRSTGEAALISSEKMSKSKHNGVDPSAMFERYGADATRAHILFQAPIDQVLEWDEGKISGVTRWLRRVLDLVETHKVSFCLDLDARESMERHYQQSTLPETEQPAGTQLEEWPPMLNLWQTLQKTVRTVTDSLSSTHTLNTVVSDLMSLTNSIAATDAPSWLKSHALYALIRMMAPVTPACGEECYSRLGGTATSVFETAFPVADDSLNHLVLNLLDTTVQIDGKMKFAMQIDAAGRPATPEDFKKWIVARIAQAPMWKKTKREVGDALRTVVVKEGKTVNFVFVGKGKAN